MTSYPVKSCQSCGWCSHTASGNLNDATCGAVVDPFTGKPLNVKIARQETWSGWPLPCGYSGTLWKAKS